MSAPGDGKTLDVFGLREELVDAYRRYTTSFTKIANPRIRARVDAEITGGTLWPEPLLQLNPTFKPGGTIDDLVAEGTLDRRCADIFRIDKSAADPGGRQLTLHTHQAEAIRKAREGKSYVLTSGTGSGKSLAYIVPIVDHVLRNGTGQGIQAIVVYPLNALVNSQDEELKKFLGDEEGGDRPPVRFLRYTGQEKDEKRKQIRANPPDVLLTNFMMLEMLLTRAEDRDLARAARGLRFLVLDELHTYRGRQGADVALLARRCRLALGGSDMVCVGTSATMASGGPSDDQKKQVASVAATFFGTDVSPDQVIGETLTRATPEVDPAAPDVASALADTIRGDTEPPGTYEEFRQAPMSSWIESAFGVTCREGALVRQEPRRLRGKDGVAGELADQTDTDEEACEKVLTRYLLKGSELRERPESRFPIFAFRLHQFLTRGDTVWATIEPSEVRHLETSKLGSKPGERHKPLFPLVFCRRCGAEYYRVTVDDTGDRRLVPWEDRSDRREVAYLYVSEDAPWPIGRGNELLGRLPSLLKETAGAGERIRRDAKDDVPEAVRIDASGRIVPEGGIPGALIRKNFLFCLNPTCGVTYTRTQRSEKAKLGTLGVDNRSTATTILAVQSLVALQDSGLLKKKARKLLSFTDNRQDASLQAGHFNDFVQVMLLRSGLHNAMRRKGPGGLMHGELASAVFDALDLRFEEYAADPDVQGPARAATQNALRRVIGYHLYRDLRWDWRITAPNLEGCGLLRFEYDGVHGTDTLLDDDGLWCEGLGQGAARRDDGPLEVPSALAGCPRDVRERLLTTLLDVMRQGLAIKVDVLEDQRQPSLVNETQPRLLEGTVWHLDEHRDLVKATVAYPRAAQKANKWDALTGVFFSSYGRYGRLVKRELLEFMERGDREEVDGIIRYLFAALRRYGVIEQVRSGESPGYQINPDAMRWLDAPGEAVPPDLTRLEDPGETALAVNPYFVECYRNFVNLKCVLEAREHTAQVSAAERAEREERFRENRLPLLFCSPTMELGVDIAELNLVNLRNVPPTPANYAQRSGRAGRSGQPALVYTYCAGRSPHDQYYFVHPGSIVSGSVTPPHIDLRNRDLIRSHLHAIWLGVARPNLGRTLMSVLDVHPAGKRTDLPVKAEVRLLFADPTHRADAIAMAGRLTEELGRELADAPWFTPRWPVETLEQIGRSFDSACDRWRDLYRAAVSQRELHHKIVGDPNRPESERNHSKRLRQQAESQISLLTKGGHEHEGDFYSYRYFATEGFLPGYNFPRLPLSAYVPGRKNKQKPDEYISRPRFLAISEFGPRALIYHEGSRYRVDKVSLDLGPGGVEATRDLGTEILKRCLRCGYAHLERGTNLAEVCDRCGSGLDSESTIRGLIRMQNVSLRMVRRITCDEEERQRTGYRMVNSYRFSEIEGKSDRRDAEVHVDGTLSMRLSYGDATTLYRINRGWPRRESGQSDGFLLDLEKGVWVSDKADQKDADDAVSPGHTTRVVPYVSDTRNALVMRFEPSRSEGVTASLQAAFWKAILRHYLLEPRELAAEAMPDSGDRHQEILFYEASEGGAGVLRRLAEDPDVIATLARKALEICHFDTGSGRPVDKKPDTCGKACYGCLLDYGNQRDHESLDRHSIADILLGLARSETRPAGGAGSREERLIALRKLCDSGLEKRWLDQVETLGLRLPSDAQRRLTEQATRPDFYYGKQGAAIYVDGPPHDEPDQRAEDAAITDRLLEAGYVVIRFHHKADWDAVFRKHPDVFGAPSK